MEASFMVIWECKVGKNILDEDIINNVSKEFGVEESAMNFGKQLSKDAYKDQVSNIRVGKFTPILKIK